MVILYDRPKPLGQISLCSISWITRGQIELIHVFVNSLSLIFVKKLFYTFLRQKKNESINKRNGTMTTWD